LFCPLTIKTLIGSTASAGDISPKAEASDVMIIRNEADLFVEATNSILPAIIRLTTVCELRQSSPPPNWPSIATHGRVEFHGYSDTPSGKKCFEPVHLADRVAKFDPRESLSGRHDLYVVAVQPDGPDCRPDARHIQGMRPVSWPRSGGPSNLRLAGRGSGRETEITLRHAMRPRLRNPDFYQKSFVKRNGVKNDDFLGPFDPIGGSDHRSGSNRSPAFGMPSRSRMSGTSKGHLP
jgi:hypothetical protein